MAGRNSKNNQGGRREQTPKQGRGNARGHAWHHRKGGGGGRVTVREAPHGIASGKDRTMEGTRRQGFMQLDDETLADLRSGEKRMEVERKIQEKGEAAEYGAELPGLRGRGTVIEVRRGNFLTRIESELPTEGDSIPRILRCVLRGTMQQFDMGLSSMVAPGDVVDLIVPPPPEEGALHSFEPHGILLRVEPRRSEFRRLHPSGRSIQTLAANVDRVVMVASCAEPDFRPGFVDRVWVCAASSGLPMALVVNKIDLGIRARDRELFDVYRGLGVPVFLTSTTDAALRQGVADAENSTGYEGFDALKNWMAGKRCVMTGHSGVGKSSLMLALDPQLNPADVRTGDVSTQTGKGTHTTTHGRLFEIELSPGVRAELVDTPGVREFTPAETDRQNLWGWFPELAKLQGQCEYSDCTHINETGCAVLAAVERGEMHPRRHQSYVRLYETLPR